MSTYEVLVSTVDKLFPHPNATSLDIVEVRGWNCIVRKGIWKEGDKCIYFPPDSILPEYWAEKFGVKPYLRNGNRVACAKLRGVPSLGLVVAPDDQGWDIDLNVADYYGATKYQPPAWARKGLSADARAEDPLFPKYLSIENLRRLRQESRWHLFKDEFSDTVGEGWCEVIATEKIHGMNFRFGLVGGEWHAGSRTVNRKMPENWPNLSPDECPIFWTPGLNENVRRLVESLGPEQALLYGEIYGPGIQPHFTYGLDKPGFILFDIFVNGIFLDYDAFCSACDIFNVPRVPKIYRGPYDHMEIITNASGKTLLNGASHIREGLVVKPVAERLDSRGNRVVLKFVSDEYHLKQYDEYADE